MCVNAEEIILSALQYLVNSVAKVAVGFDWCFM